jgi:chitodextrinase
VGLAPSTTYVFTVAARDQWGNTSRSNSVTVTTPAATNTSPPTAPPGLFGGESSGCEVLLDWSDSTDDVDPPDAIVYKVYLNGTLVTTTVGYTSDVEYGTAGTNTFSVVAVDSSGNASAPSELTLELTTC